MNGEQFDFGEKFGKLEGKLDHISDDIAEIKTLYSKDHDKITDMVGEFGTFKKVAWLVVTPILAGMGGLIWAYFTK